MLYLSLNMAVILALNILGVVVFLFLFWNRLREDYLSNQVFSSAFLIIIGVLLFYLISVLYFPFFWFWLTFLGFWLGFMLSVIKFGLKIYETLEASLVSIIPWLSFVFLGDSINNKNLISLLVFGFTIAVIPLYVFLNKRYKDFSWYKSGKIGFAGLTSIGIYFLARGLVAIFFPFVLSFVGDYETILSGIVAFCFFLLVFNLSRKDI